jgi:bacterioferritin B
LDKPSRELLKPDHSWENQFAAVGSWFSECIVVYEFGAGRAERFPIAIAEYRGESFHMPPNQNIIAAINEQIGNEFSAMLQYYAIAAYFGAEALPELSAHFHQQAEEEKQHALRFIRFVIDVGARVSIPAVPAPKGAFEVAEAAVKLSLEQEEQVTTQIRALLSMAKADSDYTTDNFLQWFIKEQLEEVSSMEQLLRVVQRAGEGNLLRVEEYLARQKGRQVASSGENDHSLFP